MTDTNTRTVGEYAVYLLAASGDTKAGTVVDRVMWDGGTSWAPPAGQGTISDPAPDRKYPIGSVYTAP